MCLHLYAQLKNLSSPKFFLKKPTQTVYQLTGIVDNTLTESSFEQYFIECFLVDVLTIFEFVIFEGFIQLSISANSFSLNTDDMNWKSSFHMKLSLNRFDYYRNKNQYFLIYYSNPFRNLLKVIFVAKDLRTRVFGHIFS